MSRAAHLAASLLALLGLAPAAGLRAQETEPREAPHRWTVHLGVASDYRARGLSQTFGEGFEAAPSIQGGVDYADQSGWYAGNSDYSVSRHQYPNGAGLEMDFYGGYRRSLGPFGVDLGSTLFVYPGGEIRDLATRRGGRADERFDTVELSAGASWQDFSLKYSYSLTDYFGLSEDAVATLDNPDDSGGPLTRAGATRGSQYLTIGWTHALSDSLSLTAGASHLWVSNYRDLNYFDYRLGLVYAFGGGSVGVSLVGSDADRSRYYAVNGRGTVQEIGRPTLVLTLGYSL